jgi:uncharacterized LabA/DUF88 family protein
LKKLCSSYVKKDNTLQDIYLFTAYPRHRPVDQQHRHKIYIKVLQDLLKINVVEGKFTTHQQEKTVHCSNCNNQFNHSYKETTEKQTDTNIVAQILEDAFLDKTDVIAIVTNDSDIIPAIRTVKKLNKKVIIFTPPSVDYIVTKNGTRKVQKTLITSVDIKKTMDDYYFPDKFNRIIDLKPNRFMQYLLSDEVPNLFDDQDSIIHNPYKVD